MSTRLSKTRKQRLVVFYISQCKHKTQYQLNKYYSQKQVICLIKASCFLPFRSEPSHSAQYKS